MLGQNDQLAVHLLPATRVQTHLDPQNGTVILHALNS